MAASSLPSLFNPKPTLALRTPISRVPFAFFPNLSSNKPLLQSPNPTHQIPLKPTAQIWRIPAIPEDVSASAANPIENSPTNEDGVSGAVSVLLFLAFVGLSILTVGVIYLSVTDFLQKREADKFEKDEATKKKRRSGKKRARARAGPRGFGQKIDEDSAYDDD